VNTKIVALESKISDAVSRVAVAAESRAISNIILSPSIINQNDPNCDKDGTTNNNVPTKKNRTCSCQSSTCNVCVRASVNASRMNVPVEPLSGSSFLSSSELPLPLFDDNSDNNLVFHLQQLDEFIRLKGEPKDSQLAATDQVSGT
jgi:hypothetical protein